MVYSNKLHKQQRWFPAYTTGHIPHENQMKKSYTPYEKSKFHRVTQ